MPEPLKVILGLAAIASGIYAVGFIKDAILFHRVDAERVMLIFISFGIVLVLGLIVWGIASLVGISSRRKKPAKTVIR